jgi:hypothetical protein
LRTCSQTKQAINHVKRCRVNIDINGGFLRQLKAIAGASDSVKLEIPVTPTQQ